MIRFLAVTSLLLPWLTSSAQVAAHDTTPIYYLADQMPEFLGGPEALESFVKKNLRYPPTQVCAVGTVHIQFVVDTGGLVRDAKTLRGIGFGYDEEALRVVNLMPKWKPGMQGGKPVPVYFSLPIVFKLAN